MPPASTRARDALTRERTTSREHMAAKRAAGRGITIPSICNARRRRRCRRDPALFLRTYMPTIFSRPFTTDQRDMIAVVMDRIEYGGWHAHAAARGDGKTSIVKGLTIYAINYGLIRFPIIIGPNKDEAIHRLADIQVEYETSDTMLEDFPEICAPIRALEGATNRGRLQTVNGARTRIRWSAREAIFPTVAGSAASGSIIMTRGIDAAIRGITYRGMRPDLVILDDIETRASVLSETETARLETTIEQDIAGLAGPGAQMPIVYLCTIMRNGSLADRYTDRTAKPAWQGTRRKLLVEPPADEKLWTQYIELRHQAQIQGDKTARAAHKHYLQHRKAMEAGAVVSNPYRYDDQELPDGSKLEVSALEHIHNLIADLGLANFRTEYQNDPPEEEAPETSGLTAAGIIQTTNGLPQGIVPEGAEYLAAAIDVGGRALHWSVVAWKDAAGYVIDYGVTRVLSPQDGALTDPENRQPLQNAILAALLDWRDWAAANGWPEAGTGQVRQIDCCLVDSGWMDTPVYEFVKSDPSRYRASKGFGTGAGQARYRHPRTKGRGRRVGNHYFATRQPAAKVWLYNIDSDYWKHFVHAGFLSSPGRAASLSLYGDDPVRHRIYANHITAEVWMKEFRTGKGWREYWNQRHRQNHYLDTTAGACAAAAILGLTTITAEAASGKPQTPSAPTRLRLSDLQRQKRTGAR